MAVARHPRAIARGCLPTARSELPSVEFIRDRIRRRAQPEQAESVAGWFWFADTDGRFSQVVVTSQERRESCRIRTMDAAVASFNQQWRAFHDAGDEILSEGSQQ
jgi:hypothetical protein